MRSKLTQGPVASAPAPPSTRTRLILAAIMVLALILRVAHFACFHDHPLLIPEGVLDDAFYHQLASRVASGHLLAGAEPFFLAPLYIYFLALVYAVTGLGPAAAMVVQVLLGVAAVWLVYRAGVRFEGEVVGLVAAGLIALDGLAAMYEVCILAASLDVVLFAAVACLSLRALASERIIAWAPAGAALGLAALNRPNALALVPLLAAWLLVTRRGWKRAALVVIAAALVILPCALRNLAVSGEPILISSHGGLNFYLGNHRGATGFYDAPPWLDPNVSGQAGSLNRHLSREVGRPLDHRQVSALLYRRTLVEIREDPRAWLRLMGKKTLALLNAREAGLNLSIEYVRELSPVLALMPVGLWLILPLAAAGALGARRPGQQLLLVLAAGYGLTVVLFFVADRYRLPLHPLLALLAGSGLSRLGRAACGRHWKKLAAAAVAIALFAGVGALNLGIDSGAGQLRVSHALRLIEAGRIDEAREVEQGMPAGTMNPFVWRARLGRAYLARRAYDDAIREFQTLVDMVPDNAGLRCDLAEALQEAGQTDRARMEFTQATRLDSAHRDCSEIQKSPDGGK